MKTNQANILAIPEPFLNRMAGLLGDEYADFLSSLHLPAITGLRVNTLKISPSEFQDRSPFVLSPVPWCRTGFILHSEHDKIPRSQPGKHPYHTAGLYYLHEPSAMAAAEALAPRPGEKVLDLAAAPGGKATHLAALMDNTSLLVANEIHPKRVWDLVENLERCGVTNAMVTNEAPNKLADYFGEYFDRVMLDAPCSGEGMFRKGEIARQEWRPELVRSCAIRQTSILDQAARMVRSGGHLAYTTCTFSPDENEGVIAKFMAQHPEFNLEAITHSPGFSSARPDWIGLPPEDRINRAVRIWPHQAPGEGHFVAVLVKQSKAGEPGFRFRAQGKTSVNKVIKPGNKALSILDDFCQASLHISFDHSFLVMFGSRMYLQSDSAPDLNDLHVIHPGWWLGSIERERFTPSHTLAMGLKSCQVLHSLPLIPEDSQLVAYFAGESLSNPGDNAWVLLTVDGYPVGWGKRVQNVLKNYYPHGLRRQG